MSGNPVPRKVGDAHVEPHVHDPCYCLDVHVWDGFVCTRCFDARCETLHYGARCTRAAQHHGRHVFG